jgi:hypothetical protein
VCHTKTPATRTACPPRTDEPIFATWRNSPPQRWLNILTSSPGREVLRDDLRLSILTTLRADPSSGHSELTLIRAVAANRSAVRYALSALEQSCPVQRDSPGRRTAIHLIEQRWLRAA